MNTRTPLIGAHRGDTASALENTMAAFEAAISHHADFIETDIRRTADGVLILHHDPEIGPLKISTTPFADLHPTPPTLEDLLLLAKEKIALDLELKESGYEPEIATVLRTHNLAPETFVITSFLESAVRQFKAVFPEAKCGLLIEDRTWPTDPSPEARLKACSADFAAAENSLITPDLVRHLASKNIPIWVWTVNDPHRIAELLTTPGIEAIITDNLAAAQAEQTRASHNLGDPSSARSCA